MAGNETETVAAQVLNEVVDIAAARFDGSIDRKLSQTEYSSQQLEVVCDYKDAVQLILNEIVNQVVIDQEVLEHNTSIHNDKKVDTLPDEPNDVKTQSWMLGVSQTGRVMDPICLQQNIFSSIAAENLVEYQWPPGSSGDYYMLQEQVSTFLNITSFKRKYPEIERRKLDPDEVNHLLSNHVISEVQVTLGLTALRSSDVCDMMMKEYPQKYNEYTRVMQEREKQKMRNKYKEYVSSANIQVEKSQINLHMKKAMKQAAAYNAHLNRQRKEDFSVYYDMSTNVLQYPRHKVRKLDPSLTEPSLYPCALIPGQFQEYYQTYSKNDLMYLPINTALYGPPQPPPIFADDDLSDSESDSASGSESSISSAPRSIKSSTSSKIKKLTGSNRSSVVGDSVAMDVSDLPDVKDTVIANEDDSNDREMPSEPLCGICGKDENSNKKGEPEDLIKCSQCDNHGHPSCLEMSDELVSVILTYNWQCMECKTCTICSQPHREDLMMFCDRCDRGYHTFCVSLRAIPSGVWACSRCTFADPDFIKRRRKQLRASQPSSGRGRGGKRRRQRRTDNKQTVIIDMNETNLSTDNFSEKGEEEAVRSEKATDDDSATPPSIDEPVKREPLIAVIKATAEGHGYEIDVTPKESKNYNSSEKVTETT